MTRLILNRILFVAALCGFTGCHGDPYVFKREAADIPKLAVGESQIVRGRPIALVDGLGHYLFSLPAKILLLNAKVDNHQISARTEFRLQEYLAHNNLDNVKVRVNQYAPFEEFDRLRQNEHVHWIWRYSLGIISWAKYTILPERLFAGLFGGDHFNPYTNTINLYSDHGSIALHEAGHAKDVMDGEWTGLYSAVRLIPFVPLWHEAIASADVMAYHEERLQNTRDLRKDRKILVPAYFSYLSGIPGPGVGFAPAFVLTGHLIGRTMNAVDTPIPNNSQNKLLEP